MDFACEVARACPGISRELLRCCSQRRVGAERRLQRGSTLVALHGRHIIHRVALRARFQVQRRSAIVAESGARRIVMSAEGAAERGHGANNESGFDGTRNRRHTPEIDVACATVRGSGIGLGSFSSARKSLRVAGITANRPRRTVRARETCRKRQSFPAFASSRRHRDRTHRGDSAGSGSQCHAVHARAP